MTDRSNNGDDRPHNSPTEVLRDGNLKASIWRNEGDKGPFYAATLARTYADRDGQPRDTHSFAGTDLLRVSELARKTYDRTRALHREEGRQGALDIDDRKTAFKQQREGRNQTRDRRR